MRIFVHRNVTATIVCERLGKRCIEITSRRRELALFQTTDLLSDKFGAERWLAGEVQLTPVGLEVTTAPSVRW